MSAKLFFPPGVNHIPQADFDTNPTENGGWEGSQSFLAKKSALVRGNPLETLFVRGVSIAALDSNCPVAYAFLRLKLFVISDHQPGIVKIACTFTGYGQEGSNGSSGEEGIVPTYSLRKDIEEVPLNEHRKWADMSDASKQRLGWLMSLPDTVQFSLSSGEYGKSDPDSGEFAPFPTGPGVWVVPTGDELGYARLIAQDRLTAKRPAWTWTVRTEGSSGFTAAQLNKAGKIVANPLGNPPTPSNDYCWLFVGPDQEQSGEKRFIKDLTYQLIPDTDENRFLYD